MSSPSTIISGALSPPIPSIATTIRSATAHYPPRKHPFRAHRRCPEGLGVLGNRLLFDDFTAIIIAAGRTNVVRSFLLAAISAFVICVGWQSVMGPAHISARLGGFLLGNCHRSTR